MNNVIKTNIKFKKNDKGHLYGFVTKTSNGSWRGVHEEDNVKKKIVFVDEMAEKDMKPGLLYHTILIPMRDDQGFICLNAVKMKFKAQIKSYDMPQYYRVEVKFGHKCICYDPSSSNKKYNDMQSIAKMIMNREDICDPYTVADMFLDAATIALTLYKREKKGE